MIDIRTVTRGVLRKLIRDVTGCGMYEAQSVLMQVAKQEGIITRREHLVAAAISGLTANPAYSYNAGEVAHQALEIADAAITQLDKDDLMPEPTV